MTRRPYRSGKKHSESRFRVNCPHCKTFARARSSQMLTETYREVRFECTNDECGFVWVAGMEYVRALCPSDTPNPDIHIPFVTARRRPADASDPATPVAATG